MSFIEASLFWPPPNYDDPVRRTWLPAFMLVWLITSAILLAGRFYLKFRGFMGSYGLDDIFIALGWVFSIGMVASIWMVVTRYGGDRHIWDVKYEWIEANTMWGWIVQILFLVSSVCTKLSVFSFQRRMIKHTVDRRWVWTLRVAFAFVSCYAIGMLITYFLICQPLSILWAPPDWNSYSNCLDGRYVSMSAGVGSVVTDFIAVLLPCFMLNHYKLRTTRKQSILLYLTFALGFIATGAGIARTYYFWKIQIESDRNWYTFYMFVWSVVECELAIICACAPALRAFYRHYIADNLFRSFGSSQVESSKSRSNGEIMPTYSTRDVDPQGSFELESGIHGVANPPPVIIADERDLHAHSGRLGSILGRGDRGTKARKMSGSGDRRWFVTPALRSNER